MIRIECARISCWKVRKSKLVSLKCKIGKFSLNLEIFPVEPENTIKKVEMPCVQNKYKASPTYQAR